MLAPKILVIPGSPRHGSCNARLAALAAKELALAGAEVTRISLMDYPLPLFDPGAAGEAEPPRHAVQLRRMLKAHHGVFITSPERNASVTPLVANTIDWLLRVRRRGEPARAVFEDRVFAIAAASRGPGGGLHGLIALRQILERGCGALVIPEEIAVPDAARAFDEMDNLKDPALTVSLKAVVRRLVDLAGAMA